MTRTTLLAAAALVAAPSFALANPRSVATSPTAFAGKATAVSQVSPAFFSGDILADDLNDLTVGPVDGQTSAAGVTYTSFDAEVIDQGGGDLAIEQVNTFADDFFFNEVEADWSATVTPAADDGFILSFDYELSDFNTLRQFRPLSAEGTFFASLQISSAGLDVLVGDGMGGASFVNVGSVPLAANLAVEVLDNDLTVLVDDVPVFTGLILGANDPGIDTGELSTGIAFPSGNDSTGAGSTLVVDNLFISVIPEPTTLALAGFAGLGMLRRRRA